MYAAIQNISQKAILQHEDGVFTKRGTQHIDVRIKTLHGFQGTHIAERSRRHQGPFIKVA